MEQIAEGFSTLQADALGTEGAARVIQDILGKGEVVSALFGICCPQHDPHKFPRLQESGRAPL